MLYDAFICHASEDKDQFVRPLAEELALNNVAVWYDEFSLKAGDSLRRSIDLGLSRSRFGIVILSEAFLRKEWPQWELDGLVQRQTASSTPVILPVWLGLSYDDVLAYSPPLADKYALRADLGLEKIVRELLKVIKPQGSSLVVARDRVIEIGFNPPVVTDDWWHEAIEYCGSNPMEGTFQSAMGWGRWGFPLPEAGTTAVEKGERIAWAALQISWQREAERQQLSQITPPHLIHEFIEQMPGLEEACLNHVSYLAAYAPQITVPGCGGIFEEIFDEVLEDSRHKYLKERLNGGRGGTALTTTEEVPTCGELIALHDPDFGHYEPALLAGNFVSGHHPFGPPVRVHENFDYVMWLLSDASAWLARNVREILLRGMREWAVWPWPQSVGNSSGVHSSSITGELARALDGCTSVKEFQTTERILDDLRARVEASIHVLHLPERPPELLDRFFAARFIEEWFRHNPRKRHANAHERRRKSGGSGRRDAQHGDRGRRQ